MKLSATPLGPPSPYLKSAEITCDGPRRLAIADLVRCISLFSACSLFARGMSGIRPSRIQNATECREPLQWNAL
jgi:hypothetical protein